ncbi:MAG TPA: pirin family protein [Rhizomicrobium sp.]
MSATVERAATASERRVVRKFPGMPTQDGAGVKLTRLVGTPQLPDLDPVLMLDTFRSDNPNDYVAGFPEHPHRGFETVSYMIKGSIAHLDNHGGKGIVTDGGVQWMTAGRGVAHSEMPAQTNGQLFGFQLWLNLPAKEKMRDPWYADIPSSDIPVIDLGNGDSAKLIVGEWNGVKGPGPDRAIQPFVADVTVAANSEVEVPVTAGHNAFLYVFEGTAKVGEVDVAKGELAVLSLGDKTHVEAAAEGARLLVVAGKPLREPIAKYGPFVMNTADEIRKAIYDYQSGKF